MQTMPNQLQTGLSINDAIRILTRCGFERRNGSSHIVMKKGRTHITLSRSGFCSRMTTAKVHQIEREYELKQRSNKVFQAQKRREIPLQVKYDGKSYAVIDSIGDRYRLQSLENGAIIDAHKKETRPEMIDIKSVPESEAPAPAPLPQLIETSTAEVEEKTTGVTLSDWLTATRRMIRFIDGQIESIEARLEPLKRQRATLMTSLREMGGESVVAGLEKTEAKPAPKESTSRKSRGILTPKDKESIWHDWNAEIPAKETAKRLGVSDSAIYLYHKRFREENTQAISRR